MAWTRGCVVLFSLSVVACDPLVPIGETSGDSAGSTGSVGSSGFSEPGSPTNSVPPNPSTTSPIGCAPGTYVECTCPGGGYGEQICSQQGEFGACECYGDDVTWGTSGSSGWWGSSGSSGWWGSSSSSGGWEPGIPELPPGQDCLGLDLPCVGEFYATSPGQLEPLGVCSRIEGQLYIEGEDTTLEPMGCLQEVDGVLGIGQTGLSDLSGFGMLDFVGELGVVQNAQLTTLGMPSLGTVGAMFIYENNALTSLGLPALTEIVDQLDVGYNPMLPNCEIHSLYKQASPSAVFCSDNLPDTCAGLCE